MPWDRRAAIGKVLLGNRQIRVCHSQPLWPFRRGIARTCKTPMRKHIHGSRGELEAILTLLLPIPCSKQVAPFRCQGIHYAFSLTICWP